MKNAEALGGVGIRLDGDAQLNRKIGVSADLAQLSRLPDSARTHKATNARGAGELVGHLLALAELVDTGGAQSGEDGRPIVEHGLR